MRKSLVEPIFHHILLVLLIVSIVSWQRFSDFDQYSFLNRLDYLFYDLKLTLSESLFPNDMPMEHVVIVDIDEASLRQEGRWPWSRSRISDLVQSLQSYGATVIAFDMVFSEPERGPFINNLVRNNDLAQDQVPALTQLLASWQPDKKLNNTLGQSDVVLGYLFHNFEEAVNLPPKTQLMKPPAHHDLLTAIGYTTSVPVIQDGALAEGFVTTFFDPDGLIRKTPLVMAYDGMIYPSLSLSAVMSYMLVDKIDIKFTTMGRRDIVTEIKVTDKPVNTDAVGRVLIPYKANAQYVKYISAKDVFNKTASEDDILGKIVFVGTSAIGLSDLIHTPFTTALPGVEVHAIVAENLLKISFPYRPVWSPGAILSIQLLLAVVLVLAFRNQKPVVMVSMAAVVFASSLIGVVYLWHFKQLDFPIVSTLMLVLCIFLWYLIFGFIKGFQREIQIKGTFSQYLPPAHIDQILQAENDYSMEGKTQSMTVLFADIRSFTTISESMTAIELKRFLNDYLTPITAVIFRHGGTIDKYVGDMVMAFWGAPISDTKHSGHAVEAALEMQQVIEALSTQFIDRGLPKVSMGIGLNTGMMNVGDMGSEYRKAYTVLGDAVNLGSRLESLTKFYGVDILIGEETVQGNDHIIFRFCDKIKVKGKNEAVCAYEPLGMKYALSESSLAMLDRYHQCIELYQARQWEQALEGFEELRQRDSSCYLYRLYIERIKAIEQQDLPADWNGVYVHKSK